MKSRAGLPIFDAHLSADALEAHIRDVTSLQVVGFARPRPLRALQRRLRGAFVAVTRHAQAGEELLPAAAWVLDHYPFLEEALVGAQAQQAEDLKLPLLQGGQVRVQRLMREAVGHSDGAVDAEVIALCARAYLSLRHMRMRELWALPRAARVALLEAAVEVACAAADAQEDRLRGQSYARQMIEARGQRLHEGDAKNPVLVERVCAVLREEGAADALDRLDRRLASLEIDREKAIEDAHRRHALLQVRIANCVKSLRALEALPWPEVFEGLSTVEQSLRAESGGVYPAMDFASRDELRREIERFARGHRCPEEQVAGACRALADAASGKEGHVGYYLAGPGRRALSGRLPGAKLSFRAREFAARHAKALFLFFMWFVSWLIPAGIFFWQGPLVALLSSLPATSQALRWAAALARRAFPARRLLRLDYEEGIPKESATLVVVPTLLTSAEQAAGQAAALEVYRAANRGPNVSFLLLGDFADHSAAERAGDDVILDAARAEIERLNRAYDGEFGILHRPRTWSCGQGRFLGRERKRGALEDLNALLLGEGGEENFRLKILPQGWKDVRFVLTVDADTVLPPGSVARLAGALAHPLNRVYSVIAPRMENLPGRAMTRLQRLLGGKLGLDSYGAASFELYQDLCGEGSFAGKGIYDARAFSMALRGKIPENAVLSHDLIEGIYAKAGLASDSVLYDAQPKTVFAWTTRLHRWTRGDWQLLPFLFRGDLRTLDRWKIADNLRRSLTGAATIACMLLGDLWFAPVALLLCMGLPRSVRALCGMAARAVLLPLEAFTQLDAAARALFRTLFSHRHMLDWMTADQADRARAQSLWRLCVPCLVCGALSLFTCAPYLALFWLPAAWYLSYLQRQLHTSLAVPAARREFLMEVARRTYGWFERRADARENDLPPDNVQIRPYRGAAHRTSPTNIGLALTADVAARDLGLIGERAMAERVARRIATIERLETWHGHLYNWYDTQTLRPLHPRYVSSVDGGNFAACLWAVAAALREAGEENLAARCDALVDRMDFSLLYDAGRKLFSIGFDAESGKLSDSFYDLLASEARLLSFLAMAKGDVSWRHYAALGRPLTHSGGRPTLLSWSGTMFEYLMPRLFLRDEPDTLMDDTLHGAVEAQIRAAQGRPWGESESGYYAFDLDLNYQYRAFGVPALSMKGGLAGETVVAPYASLLALMVRPEAACDNLRRMAEQGLLGEEGYYEAVDYTPQRLAEGEAFAIVRSTMAHHQGMGLLAIEAALGGKMLDRFAALPRVRAFRALLLEGAPERFVPSRTRAARGLYGKTYAERLYGRNARPGEAHLIAGGGTAMLIQADASGYLRHGDEMLTRFRAAQEGPWGLLLYLRDAATGESIRVGAAGTTARFEGGSAVYALPWQGIDARVDSTVSPEDGSAVYRVALQNRGDEARQIQVTAYCEPVLAPQRADVAHRAYSDLFLEAREAQANMLLFRRRPRSQQERAKCLLLVSGGGEAAGHEISRMAFLGRQGSVEKPRGLAHAFAAVGEEYRAPIEPCAASRRVLALEPGGRAEAGFALGYGEEEDELIRRMAAYAGAEGLEPMQDLHAGVLRANFAPDGVSARLQTPLVCGAHASLSGAKLAPNSDHSEILILAPDKNTSSWARIFAPWQGAGRRRSRQLRRLESDAATARKDRPDAVFLLGGSMNRLLERALDIAATRAQVELQYLGIRAARVREIERAAYILTYPHKSGRREHASSLGQEALWRFGISGDRPIVLARIQNVAQCALAREVVEANETWHSRGLQVDVVFLNDYGNDYRQPVRERLEELRRTASGIHVLSGAELSPQERALLYARAALVFEGDRGSFAAQLPAFLSSEEEETDAARAARILMRPCGRPASPLGQEALWRFGISGDRPIVLARIRDVAQCALAREVVEANETWHSRGLQVDVVFLNDYGNDYRQPVRERLEELRRTASGIYVLSGAELSPQERELLYARAALVLEGEKGSFAAQLPAPIPPGEEEATEQGPERPDLPLPAVPLQLDNGYGGFAAQGREYLIYAKPPAPWCNVIANPRFGTLVSDSGGTYTWEGNSREHKLTPWCNDPVAEPRGEGFALRDAQSGVEIAAFRRCRHGQGYTIFESGAQGLLCETTVFVDRELPIKCTRVRLRNPGKEARRVAVRAYADWVLGADRETTAPLLATGREENLLWAAGPGGGGVAFLAAKGGAVADARPCSADGDPSADLRVVLEIPAGCWAEVSLLLGFAGDAEEAARLARRFHPAESLRDVRAFWDGFLGRVRFLTPDRALTYLCNTWLPYQALSSRLWGRTAFYQAGGAYGFRDQLQDAAMLGYYDPQILREQILRCAAHQFEEGDVQHWWHEQRRGVRTRIRDDLLFLPWAVAHYVRLTGDRAILEEQVPFLRAPLLEEGQEDAYLTPDVGESASLSAHCQRAIREASRFGEHGLPLMGGGDWNDAMNRVGIQGHGESVWLGWFLCEVLRAFEPLCEEAVRASMRALRATVLRAIEAHGWDGAWYRRAYFDDGTPMGTAGSACCEIDLIAQAWAAIGGQGDPARAKAAMREAMARLFDPQAGALRLLWPPFDGRGPDAGYIAGYVPGVRENGGQYTHGAAWAALGLCALGEREAAYRLLLALLPCGRDAEQYRVEPYVAAADVYAGQHAGRGGWTWYTGSAAWLWRAAAEGLGGLRPEDAREGPLVVAIRHGAPEEVGGGTSRGE